MFAGLSMSYFTHVLDKDFREEESVVAWQIIGILLLITIVYQLIIEAI